MLVEFALTASAPVIRHDGGAFTVTVFVLVELQPDVFEVVSVRINEPAPLAVTFTDEPVAEPIMLPFPLILHE